MPKRDPIPKSQDGYLRWHDNLKLTLTGNTPGATTADVTMLSGDNADLHAKMSAVTAADNASRAAHAALTDALESSQSRVRALVQRVKKSVGYSVPVGEVLQIEGPEETTDLSQARPVLSATEKPGGVVELAFQKLGAEGVHVYSQLDGEAGFRFLASETHSPYVDNRSLAVTGKPEIRRYMALYFNAKAEVGQQSAVVQATARP